MSRRGFFRDRTRESRERVRKKEVFGSENLIEFDMLRNLGVLGAVVETYAQFRRNSVKPVTASPLPAGAAALQRRIMDVQKMTLDASIANDRDLAFAALLNDPLVRISPDKAHKMFDAMLEYTRAMLPGM
jgi:alpha-galactosidase/6-phospho-beta-glucosidase family protein